MHFGQSASALPKGVWLCARAVWLTGLISHGYWLIQGLAAGQASLAASVPLALAVAFFASKTIDLPCLRVRMSRRALAVLAVLVVFVHADVIVPSSEGAEPLLLVMSLEATTGALLRSITHVLPIALAALALAVRYCPTHDRVLQWSIVDAIARVRRLMRVAEAPLRAPPCC